MPEIHYPAYRTYVDTRVEANDAMMALLAGSRLAAHTLQLTEGSTATIASVFPAVEHIRRFDLRSDIARDLLRNADFHLASVAVTYALATHEDFATSTLTRLRDDFGRPCRGTATRSRPGTCTRCCSTRAGSRSPRGGWSRSTSCVR